MQHYGVNNTMRNNVFAHSVGGCQSFDADGPLPRTLPALSNAATVPKQQHLLEHCSGYLWDPAYRGQQCEYAFTTNVVAMSGPQGYVHQGPEGRCNGSYSKNLYWNSTGKQPQSGATVYSSLCVHLCAHI